MADDRKRPQKPPALPLPLGTLVVLAWLVPGAGHFVLHRRLRAYVFAALIVAAFVLGLVLQGELAVPKAGDPLSYLAAVADLGNGLLYFLGRLVGLGAGTITASSFEYGNTFLLTGGMMNLLLVLDTYDIAMGRKTW